MTYSIGDLKCFIKTLIRYVGGKKKHLFDIGHSFKKPYIIPSVCDRFKCHLLSKNTPKRNPPLLTMIYN